MYIFFGNDILLHHNTWPNSDSAVIAFMSYCHKEFRMFKITSTKLPLANEIRKILLNSYWTLLGNYGKMKKKAIIPSCILIVFSLWKQQKSTLCKNVAMFFNFCHRLAIKYQIAIKQLLNLKKAGFPILGDCGGCPSK